MSEPLARPRPRPAPPVARPRPTNGAADELPPWAPTDADAPEPEQWHPDADELAHALEQAESGFLEPEDRGLASLSPLGDTWYVGDLIRPGRIAVVAAEEGTGKSYAITGELGIRVATAGGAFAGTWPVLATGPVLVLSEMHGDDDYEREGVILGSLGLTRDALRDRYYRLPLATAAGDRPALQVAEWRAWVAAWLRLRGALLVIFDTATAAAQVDPWGDEIHGVYRGLRAMLAEHPALAIVLVVHLKKPQGQGKRRISDVLGEWGRWCDVLLLLEADGVTRVLLTSRKRVRSERRIVATKAGGLLVDPVDADELAGPRVPQADVMAAVRSHPGIGYLELGALLGVSKDTAGRYAANAEKAGLVTQRKGANRAWQVFAADVDEREEDLLGQLKALP
jgi:hypothetical protein